MHAPPPPKRSDHCSERASACSACESRNPRWRSPPTHPASSGPRTPTKKTFSSAPQKTFGARVSTCASRAAASPARCSAPRALLRPACRWYVSAVPPCPLFRQPRAGPRRIPPAHAASQRGHPQTPHRPHRRGCAQHERALVPGGRRQDARREKNRAGAGAGGRVPQQHRRRVRVAERGRTAAEPRQNTTTPLTLEGHPHEEEQTCRRHPRLGSRLYTDSHR